MTLYSIENAEEWFARFYPALEDIFLSYDEFEDWVIKSSRTEGGYSVELLTDGTYRCLPTDQLGGKRPYKSAGIVVRIPQLSHREWDEETGDIYNLAYVMDKFLKQYEKEALRWSQKNRD